MKYLKINEDAIKNILITNNAGAYYSDYYTAQIDILIFQFHSIGGEVTYNVKCMVLYMLCIYIYNLCIPIINNNSPPFH